MEKDLIKIEIVAKEIHKKDSSETFIAYKGYTKKGWYDLKFVRDCKNIPTKTGTISVLRENVNVNRTSKFPVIWVKNVEDFEEYKTETKVADYFD